jgi:acyl-CoA synthetase (AMP-forming)/AMP-acid ligase II
MKDFMQLIKKLHSTQLLTFKALYFLFLAIFKDGINALMLLGFISKLHKNRDALHYDEETLTYPTLYAKSLKLAKQLHFKYNIHSKSRVAIITFNSSNAIISLFATSRLGANIYMLNPNLSQPQFLKLFSRMNFDFYIYDDELKSLFTQSKFKDISLSTYGEKNSIKENLKESFDESKKLRYFKPSMITVLTGGTTKEAKPASRSSFNFGFLYPFSELLLKANLDNYRLVYIATPIYHGFGLSAVFIATVLGAKMYVDKKFEVHTMDKNILNDKIEVVIGVPLMINRLMKQDKHFESLKVIVSGGAMLYHTLATHILETHGEIIYNLYGTSEAGFCIMATPKMLKLHPNSIGKVIRGVKLRLADDGELEVKTSWSIDLDNWIKTGDRAIIDDDGMIFLKGRVDDMIVSGGENVYPLELETILLTHEDILEVGVIGVKDEEFGERLKAIVVKKEGSNLDKENLKQWIKEHGARHLVPSIIEFREKLDYTHLGKLDKVQLK